MNRPRWAAIVPVLMLAGLALWPRAGFAAEPAAMAKKVHVVYGTDLFHPHDDPDDHYDLATLFAIPSFEIEAILLDLGDRQRERPGRVPVEQMLRITGRKAPYAAGLSKPLASPQDKALDRPAEDQKAIELLIATLHTSAEPVTVITAGSLRDVCAAFNRAPELFKAKLARLYINVGSAERSGELNVTLDLFAFLGVMRSGLPVYWCPCMPVQPNPYSTYWKFPQGQMLEGLPRPVLNYFVYALQRVRTDELDPTAAIDGDLRMWRQLPGLMERNMWCTASFLDAAGWGVRKTAAGYVPTPQPGPDSAEILSFVPAMVDLDEKGQTRSIKEDPQGPIHVFKTLDNKRYQQAMTDCLRWLLMRLTPSDNIPLSPPQR